MKNSLLTAILALMCPMAMAQVDYSKCQDFIHPKGGMMGESFGGMNPVLGYVPFEMGKDGKVTPHQDVIAYEQDKDTKQEVLVYEIPSYEYISPEELKNKNPYKQKMQQMKVVIKRDESGNITEIVRGQAPSQEEIDKQVKFQKDFYEKNTPESVKKQNLEMAKNMGQEGVQLPFYKHTHTSIKFETKNGQCVPVESTNKMLVEPKVDGKTIETTSFNTHLCKDIDKFLTKNPEAASCFKKSLNDQVSSIFKKHIDPSKMSGYGMGGYGGYMGPYGGMGMNFNPSLELKVSMNSIGGPAEAVESIRKATGSSPVITAHQILQMCYQQGLDSFIKDPDIWKSAGVSEEAESGGSGATANE